MAKTNYYVVSTWNDKTQTRWTYYEDGYNAQEAVDRVKTYKGDEEIITDVYKKINNWK